MSPASLPLKNSPIRLIFKQIQNTSQELNLRVKKKTCLNLFPCNKNLLKTKSYHSNAMFRSLEGEESRGEESREEWLFSTLFRCF